MDWEGGGVNPHHTQEQCSPLISIYQLAYSPKKQSKLSNPKNFASHDPCIRRKLSLFMMYLYRWTRETVPIRAYLIAAVVCAEKRSAGLRVDPRPT